MEGWIGGPDVATDADPIADPALTAAVRYSVIEKTCQRFRSPVANARAIPNDPSAAYTVIACDHASGAVDLATLDLAWPQERMRDSGHKQKDETRASPRASSVDVPWRGDARNGRIRVDAPDHLARHGRDDVGDGSGHDVRGVAWTAL